MSRNIKILDRTVVPPGTIIIEQGCLGSRAYIIESGMVEVFMVNSEGKRITVAELGPGALIGEIALVDDGQRNASVMALEATTLIAISAQDFQRAMKKSEAIQKSMLQSMATRVQEMMSLLKKHEPPRQRREGDEGQEEPLLLDKMMMTLQRLSDKLRK